MDTKNRLHIKLAHLEKHDFPNGIPFWGEISIIHNEDSIDQMLLQTQWNVDELVEAFIDRIDTLATNTLPKEGVIISLAQQLDELTQQDYDNDDDELYWGDLLYNFRWTHSLPLWLGGALIPEIIIGQKNDEGEISCAECSLRTEGKARYKKGDWAFKFDLQDFLLQFRGEAIKFLEDEMKVSANSEETIKRARQLLNQLNQG